MKAAFFYIPYKRTKKSIAMNEKRTAIWNQAKAWRDSPPPEMAWLIREWRLAARQDGCVYLGAMDFQIPPIRNNFYHYIIEMEKNEVRDNFYKRRGYTVLYVTPYDHTSLTGALEAVKIIEKNKKPVGSF